MWLLGYTLNLMTLLAMSLIIGILVDDATVVLENIQRHLDMGKEKRKAAMDGRMEIGFSALSITLVDVVVFADFILTGFCCRYAQTIFGSCYYSTLNEFVGRFYFNTLVSFTHWKERRFATYQFFQSFFTLV
jgi:multidrug efflux pump subunit AcrB